MTEIQTLVDAVRGVVRSADHTLTDELRDTAGRFAAACRKADDRLRRCEDFLRRGLWPEAVHQAEIDPPLLDTLTRLDFPDRPAWDELAAMYGLPRAPAVEAGRAAELNRAYQTFGAVGPLVRKYRGLNRARAPLGERVAVLRELDRADPGNPNWQQQLERHESVRLKQLEKDLEQADAGRNRFAVFRAADEIADALARLNAQHPLVRRAAGLALPHVAAQLDEALGRKDVDGLRLARGRWQRTVPLLGGPIPEAVSAKAVRALGWLDDIEEDELLKTEYDAALSELSHVLSQKTLKADALDAAYDRLRATGRKVPGRVQALYEERSGELRERRNTRAIWITSVVFVLLAFGVFAFILSVARRG